MPVGDAGYQPENFKLMRQATHNGWAVTLSRGYVADDQGTARITWSVTAVTQDPGAHAPRYEDVPWAVGASLVMDDGRVVRSLSLMTDSVSRATRDCRVLFPGLVWDTGK